MMWSPPSRAASVAHSTSARTPGRVGEPRQPGCHSTSLNLASAGVEKRWDMSIWSASRMLTAKCPECLKAEQLRDARAIDHRTSGGSSDNEENEFAVTPTGLP